MPTGQDPEKKPCADALGVLRESVYLAIVGVLIGLAANQLSPRGLTLGRDYFYSSSPTNTSGIGQTNAPGLTVLEKLAAELKAKGLQLADSNLAYKLFNDPRFAMELVIFIDVRDDKHYQEGHIPGAYQLDYYHPANYLPAVLPICQTAEQIVVYCNGGDCEDSQFTALMLAGHGIAKDKLFVYAGGMAEWTANGWPVEIGARKSGNIRQPVPTTSGGAK